MMRLLCLAFVAYFALATAGQIPSVPLLADEFPVEDELINEKEETLEYPLEAVPDNDDFSPMTSKFPTPAVNLSKTIQLFSLPL